MNQPSTAKPKKPKFPLGALFITPGAQEVLSPEEIQTALSRHGTGDGGEVCAEDQQENELSLRQGFRLLSAYTSGQGEKFWIISEADRSSTTVLLPAEY